MEIVLALVTALLFCSQAIRCNDSNHESRTLAFVSEGSQRILLLKFKRSITAVPECEILSDWGRINEILENINSDYVHNVDETQFQEMERDCNEISNEELKRAESATEISSEEPENGTVPEVPGNHTFAEAPGFAEDEGSWKIIFPGTKWCGAGDKAENYDDLGYFADTDKCCRAHDLCDDIMTSGETRNNLTNDSPFTKLSCQCDNDFYECLEKVDSVVSNKIGNLYFNILRRECYTWDYPKTKKCLEFHSFLKITCKKYERDTTAPQIFRWKKAKLYKKLPIPGL